MRDENGIISEPVALKWANDLGNTFVGLKRAASLNISHTHTQSLLIQGISDIELELSLKAD